MTDGGIATEDRSDLDQLIPPPWSRGRRVVAAVVAASLVAGLVVLARSGALVPQLDHGDAWGTELDASDPERLEVRRWVRLRNTGWVTAEVGSLQLPDIDGVDWGDVDGLPATIPAGETHEIVLELTVAGCELHAGGFDAFPVRAAGPLLPERTVTIDAAGSSDPTIRAHHLDEDGETVAIVPPWPDQPPSWILDAIHPACSESPDD